MKNYSNRFYQRETIQFNFHFISNVENYYADKSIPLWNRILVYLCIFQMEHKREIFVSNKFLAEKFDAPLCTVKYSMGVINKKGFATYTTVTVSDLKGKHRTINLNYKKLKKLLSVFSWSDSKLDRYEKKFVRNRIISIIRKNKKRNIEMMLYFRFLQRQRGNRIIGKHVGNHSGVSFRRIDEEIEFYETTTNLARLKREFLQLSNTLKETIIKCIRRPERREELLYLANNYRK